MGHFHQLNITRNKHYVVQITVKLKKEVAEVGELMSVLSVIDNHFQRVGT